MAQVRASFLLCKDITFYHFITFGNKVSACRAITGKQVMAPGVITAMIIVKSDNPRPSPGRGWYGADLNRTLAGVWLEMAGDLLPE